MKTKKEIKKKEKKPKKEAKAKHMKKKFDNFFLDFEKRWQAEWREKGIFKAVPKGKKFYCLEMFPYPSGKIHMGHVRNYTIGDAIARFKRMQGFSVLYPMGFDAFGLPAENAAIARGLKPDEWTEKNVIEMIENLRALGLSYDWDRKIVTYEPDYYKWEQLFFLRFLKAGLAYKEKSSVNYCKKCDTVLANEQVLNDKCWRCGTQVEEKDLEQWFFRTTKYSDELINGLEKLDWPERVKIMQRNWIGKSFGSEIVFPVKDSDLLIKVFTTRIDTLFGCTFIALSPELNIVAELTTQDREKEVRAYLAKIVKKTMKEREEKGKTGCFIGSYAINPVNGKEVPIFIAEYVLPEYGTGAIMCVPSHDARDYDFAKKHELEIIKVIKPVKEENVEVFVDDGILIESGKFSGMTSEKARIEITKFLEKSKKALFIVNYKLKDWLLSRQRYWGCPIPIIYCKKCGMVPVPEKELPVLLPPSDSVEFGKGNPLLTNREWLFVRCPQCNSEATRETDTMDTFVDSSWYFLRYCSAKEHSNPFNSEIDFWMPVDFYIGGIEHATGHLIYSRFFTKALSNTGFINKKLREPFSRLVCQGMVLSKGEVMSKSKGNVVAPDEIIEKYGADALRLYHSSVSLPESELEWNDKGMEGSFNFLLRFHRLLTKTKSDKSIKEIDIYITNELQLLIKKFTENVEALKLSIALSDLFSFIDKFSAYRKYISENVAKNISDTLILLLTPFIPHLCEELWHMNHKTFASLEKWPVAKNYDKDVAEDLGRIEKLSEDVGKILNITGKKASKIYIYCVPSDFDFYKKFIDLIAELLHAEIFVYSVTSKGKYDPQGKAGKTKLGKPAIYIE
ncbi:leucine--tRNA ligase [Candidatus Pacearchaeota archaeon]|nr:leucine--tRNA ligase [Candidatus Pacearchaeota archaeon]